MQIDVIAQAGAACKTFLNPQGTGHAQRGLLNFRSFSGSGIVSSRLSMVRCTTWMASAVTISPIKIPPI